MRKALAFFATLSVGAVFTAPLHAADQASSSQARTSAPAPARAAVVQAAAVVASTPADPAKAAAQRGRAVFEKNCVMCHGQGGKGDGRVAKLYTPPPANLVISTKSDTYKTMIIRKGGAYVGRSLTMPSWDGQLSTDEIGDVVAYLREIAQPH